MQNTTQLVTSMFKQKEETQPMLLTSTGRKRIRERFRATLAGLLELEVLRARHKVMVETALGKTEETSHATKIQEQQYQYFSDKDTLRLRRSFSEEAVHDTRKERGLWSCSSHSSEDLLYCQCFKERSRHHQELHTHTQLQSRASSGFCDSDFGDGFTLGDDTVSSLSTSMASLRSKYSSGELEYFMSETTPRNLPILFHNNKQHRRQSQADLQSHFSDEVIPEDGFLSVAYLYPDSHWPVVSEILQSKVVLQPTYRTDLPGHQGMEVYRYPSPLHAVALQSPLYAPHSPQNNRKKNERHFSRRSVSNSSSLQRQDSTHQVLERPCCHSKSYLSSNLLWRDVHPKNHRCEEVIWKRVHSSIAAQRGTHSRSKRSMQRTSSLGRNKSFICSFQSKSLQKNKDISAGFNERMHHASYEKP